MPLLLPLPLFVLRRHPRAKRRIPVFVVAFAVAVVLAFAVVLAVAVAPEIGSGFSPDNNNPPVDGL
ncbi:hypothetical protein [Granulicella sp. L46]|uniref:hypothetical protein n=1 Tax=Granulicella sp. L46 TaxID=1641865 RepID=UPI00131E7FBC|nr:hypothetical protein [Granulicella sp. L46]